MDPQLWKQVDALFEAALEQPPEKRKSFVAEASKGNAIIYEEVLSLLDAQARAAEFMEGSAMSVAAGALAQELTTIATLVGKEVGTYKIEKLLGAGGMAEVYLARDSKLDRMIALNPRELEAVMPGEEDTRVKVPAGFDPGEVRLIGKISGEPPFTGTLRHHGWRVTEVKLPTLTEGVDRRVLAPAEVEIASA